MKLQIIKNQPAESSRDKPFEFAREINDQKSGFLWNEVINFKLAIQNSQKGKHVFYFLHTDPDISFSKMDLFSVLEQT